MKTKMARLICVLGAIVVLGTARPSSGEDAVRSPYAGQEARPIKALSQDEIVGLRNGDGMGFAKAAELNGYPGPAHVLALSQQLRLSPQQLDAATAIRERMAAAARALGAEIIEHEAGLDRLFAQRDIDSKRLAATTAQIAALQGRLRDVHLAAHLEMRGILTAEQIARYASLRGYADNMPPDHGHMSGHHH